MADPLKYAGFWRRALALVADYVIVLGVTAVQAVAAGVSIPVAVASNLVGGVVSVGYPIYFHARWGQTVGKMLTKIKVTRLDGAPLGLRPALLRSSVDVVLWVVFMVGLIRVLVTWTGPEWSSLGFLARGYAIEKGIAPISHWAYHSIDYWFWGELVVLLTNRKRRALQDFIAGTVVVEASP